MKLDLRASKDVFSKFYRVNHWGGSESRSGKGSSLNRGIFLAERIPVILDALGVRSIVDVPCGDVNWMSRFPLDGRRYIGVDVVPELIEENRRRHGGMGEFLCLDACYDPLPDADLVFCRDLLSHLPNAAVELFLSNVCRTAGKWLLCGRFLGPLGPSEVNGDISFGDFRSIDLCEAPFLLPAPVVMVPEYVHKWKTLGLWRIDCVRKAIAS